MMKYLILVFIAFTTFAVSAQTVKYVGVNAEPLTKKQFEKSLITDMTSFTDSVTATDTIYQLHSSNTVLPADETKQLYSYLSAITGQQLDKNSPAVFYYYSGSEVGDNPRPETHLTQKWHDELNDRLNLKGTNGIFVIYSSDQGLQKRFPGMRAYFDKDGVIGKYFSQYNSHRGLFMLHPDNRYALMRGEYSRDAVFRKFEILKKG